MKQEQKQAPTFESVWALLEKNAQKLEESNAAFDRRMQEADKRREESNANFGRELKESRADFDRRMKESKAGFDREMEKINKTLGGWANNQGSFAEEYFFNSFENGKKNFFGEKFDDVDKNLKGFWQGIKDEYDIVLYNHTSVALIEVKYKAHENDIPSVIKKAETFRILFPVYKEFTIYLGLASLSFYPELEQECIKQGIAVIKQVGDTVVVNDKYLKVF